jgi:hypothetical protein
VLEEYSSYLSFLFLKQKATLPARSREKEEDDFLLDLIFEEVFEEVLKSRSLRKAS